MYAKVFQQFYESSIINEPLHVRYAWLSMIVLADPDGVLDMPISVLARRINLTDEQTQNAIDRLSSPDPESRSPDHEGRRLLPLCEHRTWGWRLVNYSRYREIVRQEHRREYRKDWMRARREQDVNTCEHPVNTCEHPVNTSDGDGEADEDLSSATSSLPAQAPDVDVVDNSVGEANKPKRKRDLDPTAEELDAFQVFLEATERSDRYKLTPKRLVKLRARLKEVGHDGWRQAVYAVAASPFHRGENDRGKRYDGLTDKWCRSAEDIEKWIEAPRPSGPPPQERYEDVKWEQTRTRTLPDGTDVKEIWKGRWMPFVSDTGPGSTTPTGQASKGQNSSSVDRMVRSLASNLTFPGGGRSGSR